jgi:hypothetical protein
MKLPTRVEQGQTEHKGPAPAQVGCSAESRLEQKEGYGWHALRFVVGFTTHCFSFYREQYFHTRVTRKKDQIAEFLPLFLVAFPAFFLGSFVHYIPAKHANLARILNFTFS